MQQLRKLQRQALTSSIVGWLSKTCSVCVLFSLVIQGTHAQSHFISPGKNLEVLGVPPIPTSISRDVQPYSGMYGLPVAGWSPTKREIWLKGLSSVTWVSRVATPGASPETTSTYIQSNGIYDIYFQPQGEYLAYTRDANGNESFQLYLYKISAGQSTLLSDGKSRNTEPVWSNSGNRIVYSSSPSGNEGVNIRFLDPFDPKTDRLLVKSSGSYLKAYDWSPDDKTIVYCDFTSNTTSTLWLADIETGKSRLISERADKAEFYDFPQFSNDGKKIYVVTDHDSDYRRLAYLDLSTGKTAYVPSPTQWDVEDFQISPDGKTIAFISNEEGISRLHLFDLASNKELPLGKLPLGIISDLKWRSNSAELAFNLKSPHAANDVYSVNIQSGKLELWFKSVTNGVDTTKFAQPELIHWKTFDERTLSGFLYRPPTKFKGKRPVIIDIHGGPEEQFRPVFLYEENYLLNDLGVAKLYPNVRGSSGYGRAFLKLDNGPHRSNAVKDIGALLDWIRTQPELDSERILVQGFSYGGYLALSTAFSYGDRIKAAISDSGISDLGSFVAHTEGWRRALQRSEFGDERDPRAREFMGQLSPLNHVQKIRTPLLIIQGQNDPRVPVSDTGRLVAATKKQVPVWYILAKDEGHGFIQKQNRDYRLYATLLFIKEFLLK